MAVTVFFTNGQLARLEQARSAAWTKADPDNRSQDPELRSNLLLVCYGEDEQVVGEFRAKQVVGYELDEGRRDSLVTIATAEEVPVPLGDEPNVGRITSNN